MKRMVKQITAFILVLVLLCTGIPMVVASEIPYSRDIDVVAKRIVDGYSNVYSATVRMWQSAEIQAEDFGFTFSTKNLLSSTALKVHHITPDTDGFEWFESCMSSFGGKIAPFDIYCVKNNERAEFTSSLTVSVTLPEEYVEPELYVLDQNGNVAVINLSGSGNSYSFTVSKSGYYVFVDAADLEEDEVVTRYTVTASAEKGGSISPSGAQVVTAGTSMTFTIIAEDGYKISDVIVDEVSMGEVDSYTLEDIQTDHSIEATFERTEVTVGTIIEDIFDLIFGDWFGLLP